jgi:hypothetical protein
MNTFEARRLARIERLKTAAARKAALSDSYHNKSRAYTEYIPFGQPILVGHHSEGAHRNALDKSWKALGKAVEAGKESADLARRAAAAENSTAIFSDDPEAVQKLKEQINSLEKNQDLMKRINTAYKKLGNLAAVAALPEFAEVADLIKDGEITLRVTPYHGKPFPGYALSNNSANIRRLKARLAEQEKRRAQTTTETVINCVTIRENVEDNRCQLIFPGIPSQEIRDFLKSRGFRWSRYNSAWQRHRSNAATFYAKEASRMQPAPAEQPQAAPAESIPQARPDAFMVCKAQSTLMITDEADTIGQTKAEARQVLKAAGWTDQDLDNFEAGRMDV